MKLLKTRKQKTLQMAKIKTETNLMLIKTSIQKLKGLRSKTVTKMFQSLIPPIKIFQTEMKRKNNLIKKILGMILFKCLRSNLRFKSQTAKCFKLLSITFLQRLLTK